MLRISEKLTIQLDIANAGEVEIGDIRIFSTGPWDKFTVTDVQPRGWLDCGLLGWNLLTPLRVPAGQTRFVRMAVSPNEPGNHQFSFELNSGTRSIRDKGDQPNIIGITVAVTR